MLKKIRQLKLTYIILLLVVFFIPTFYVLIPLPYPLFPDDYSMVVLDANGKMLRVFLNRNQQWCFPPDENLKIPMKLKNAVLQFEDRHFYRHPGVNPVSLVRAFYQNIRAGRTVSGASTLTMQLARLMQPKPRTYPNKLLEILQAVKIEIKYSKEEILRMYLDHAPYGGNIIGYQAASWRYFGKRPEQLTWGEAATLAVLPNSPGLISPVVNREKLSEKKNRLLRKLRQAGFIDQESFELAKLEPLPSRTIPFPFIAPHLTEALHRKVVSNKIIRTTIKKEIQRQAAETVREQLENLRHLGIRNGAALIAETKSGKVRAYVGSQDFFATGSNGQVDGVKAARSSGSILKPFLYALAMDDGLILPQTVIRDVPTYFGSYSPTNADQKFSGLVSAREALVRSLNVPAVRLLNAYGLYSFYRFLQDAGVSTLFRPPDDYGLPLILGGAEVNLWDLAQLFRGLGNYGVFSDLQVLERKDSKRENSYFSSGKSLISPGACYLVLNILRELKRPGAEYYWQQYQNQWQIAWKTGTSYGQRDAWAVGVSPQWTIAVWVGNFDGEPNPEIKGASCAGPLLFDLFNLLPKDAAKSWFAEPSANLSPVKICLETGFRAGADCPHTTVVEAPMGMKPLKQCPYHKSVFVTSDERYQVCSLCWESEHRHKISLLFYPPDVAQYLRERGQVLASIPPHNPACPGLQAGNPMQIVYPGQNARLWIPRDIDGRFQQVTLRVAHRQPASTIFWYIDNRYLGETKENHVKALTIPAGWHTLEVVDRMGNRDRRRFFVALKKRS